MSTADQLANRHFLVVDDEEFIRTLITRFLKQAGAAGVVEAADGLQAIEAIRNSDMAFDAVITDIKMRQMNGLQLLRAIRCGARGLKRNTPVLVLTAHAEAEHVAEALALDADAFVVKPVGREPLIDRVVRVLERTVPIQSVESYGPAPSTLRANVPQRESIELSQVKEVPLGQVKENSILTQDIHIGNPEMLLVAAPIILTKALLDRLKDLGQLHDGSQLSVVEPRFNPTESSAVLL
jgi:two-component system chemotaxis response regulator CheY